MNGLLRVVSLSAALLLGVLAGCGGGGGNPPPVASTEGVVSVQGVVTVRAGLLSARGASDAETPVAGATVSFYEEGHDTPQAITTSDDQGRYALLVRAGVRGRLRVTQENRQLSALVDADDQTTGVLTRDVCLESTVVEIALRDQTVAGVDVEAMEEQVRIGESPDLLAEVADAYADNRPPTPGAQVLAQTATHLVSGEQATMRDCLTGQEWCVVTARLTATPGETNSYTSRLLLRRDRTDTGNATSSTATVGAGFLVVQLPSGFTLQSVKGATGLLIEKGDMQTGNTVQVSFLYRNASGIAEATKLAELTLTTTRAPTADDRLAITTQRLLGVLNEKRAATTSASAQIPSPLP